MESATTTTGRKRIVVVEDDESIALGLRVNLEAEGYEAMIATDGRSGLELVRRGCDLVVLDLMIPTMNGFEVLRRLRAEGIRTPVLVLSARGAEMDKVTGLDLGAEDYVTKPFSLAELLARIRTLLRRAASQEPPKEEAKWGFGDVSIDPETREVLREGEPVDLTRTEFDVLQALHRVAGRVLSREQILEAVWGQDHHGTARTVDNFIAQLRSKLESDPAEPKHLVTVRGVGYRLVP